MARRTGRPKPMSPKAGVKKRQVMVFGNRVEQKR